MISRLLYLAGNTIVGALAGLGWPFLYLAGYAVAARAGWITGDPRITEDYGSFAIRLGATTMLVLTAMFAGVNIPLRARGRLPFALLLVTIVAVLVSRQTYR
ncbi:hypothetical protein ACWT_3953 [Actinoplanes sp. SE50]|uniref:hypothetical protein n=1 Tax=unclassified Actinoplanes TaxID=2626549 RepID=UPI00023ED445|nr:MULTISPECIES: hypothetical protein [unclassified Actinoplanes]AEV84977.1 hypothetical protein ACPL_4082 [Actinoplanes sp. SE50/110]ATO83368.1 hypothetical protein ACWT_3953 [Actinoplanes sp. SE50]SLM00775.1 hypothetical protein ACSP50_4008 [Actinoplanes sp. SE50/110]